MPEGDAVFRTARRVHDALAGRSLTEAEIRWGSRELPPVVGRVTLEVVPVGKHLLHRIEGGVTVHSHLRMEGRWQVSALSEVSASQRRSPNLRALFATESQVALGWRLGVLEVLPTRDEARVVGHLGPDVLGADWALGVVIANLRRAPSRPLAESLLDQRNLAGLGTIFTAEPLYAERVHPWALVGDLDDATLTRVLERARRQISLGMHTSRPSLTGDPRNPTAVHGRSGRPCRRCGDTVRVAMTSEPTRERTIFYCPTCQGGLGPTDDGRPQRPLGSGSRRSGPSYRSP